MARKGDFANKNLLEKVLEASAHDHKLRRELQRDPARALAGFGFSVPRGTKAEFNKFFGSRTNDMFMKADASGDGFVMAAWPSFGCTICSVAAWTVATLIVGVGAAALATLTLSSKPVLALAAFAGVSAKAALAFIVSVGTAVGAGIAKVTTEICKWMEFC